METTTARVYRHIGTTDDVTSCDYCGRIDLQATVVLAVLDHDGNDTGARAYFGTGCAATAGHATVREIHEQVRTAQQAERDAQQAERDRAHHEFITARDAWISEHYGPDALDQPGKYGFTSPFRIVQAFRAATGRN